MGGAAQFRVKTCQVEDAATTSAVDRPDGTDTGMNAMAQALALVTTRSEAPIARKRAPRVAAAPAVPRGRSFACCPETDQIAVIDAIGGLCEVFGEPGAGPGQFDQPSHVIVVSPRFEGEDAQVEGIALVAVADRVDDRNLIGLGAAREAPAARNRRRGCQTGRAISGDGCLGACRDESESLCHCVHPRVRTVRPVDSACRRGVLDLAGFDAKLRRPAQERPARA